MKLIQKTALATLVSAAVFSVGLANAKTTADKAAQLGGRLTPMGSEKAGNASGTIPAWEGGITRPAAGYRAGSGHPNPYASDKMLFQVTPENYTRYADALSEGQKAMFQKYKTYRMDVFPIPNNAYELIWNHKLKYKGVSVRSFSNQAAPTAGGAYTLTRLQEEILGLYYKPGNTSESINNILLYFKQDVLAPARLAGGVLLVHESMNAKAQPRQAWVYNPGQRRVRRAPNVAYDNPGTASDGLRTNDMTDMFNGAMDRFSWTLVGKKEMLIPYNAYDADSEKLAVKDLIRPGHINPEHLRYEWHRVWVVEAKLKPGQRHINSRRTFYLDEDSYQIVMVDHYDGQGKLWRYSEALPINYYEVPTLWTTLETHHDLKSGRYITGLLDNDDKPRDFSFQSTPADYSPQNLRNSGVR